VTLASGIAGDETDLRIRADARVAGATIKSGETVRYPLGSGRHAYLVLARGKVRAGDVIAGAGDGLAIREEREIALTALEDSEVVLVDAG
jgi:redox-sensitive bicupin YhaK (pirin superfamily)